MLRCFWSVILIAAAYLRSCYGTQSNFWSRKKTARIKGLIINKFRGDKTILDAWCCGCWRSADRHSGCRSGCRILQVSLEDEDSLSEPVWMGRSRLRLIDIAVIRVPRISNFTDFNVFEQH